MPANCLIGLQHGAGLGVVDGHRPVVLHRHIGWHVQLVGLASIEGLVFGIQTGDQVIRTGARLGQRHGGSTTTAL